MRVSFCTSRSRYTRARETRREAQEGQHPTQLLLLRVRRVTDDVEASWFCTSRAYLEWSEDVPILRESEVWEACIWDLG